RIVQPARRRQLGAGPGALAATAVFRELAEEIGRALDGCEGERLTGKHCVLGPDGQRLARRVERASTDIQALFGSGDVAEHADRLAMLTTKRAHLLLTWPSRLEAYTGAPDTTHARAVLTARAEFDTALTNFDTAARRALRSA